MCGDTIHRSVAAVDVRHLRNRLVAQPLALVCGGLDGSAFHWEGPAHENTTTPTRYGATSSSACRPLYRPTGPSKHDGGAPRTSLVTHSTENPVQGVDADARCRAQ